MVKVLLGLSISMLIGFSSMATAKTYSLLSPYFVANSYVQLVSEEDSHAVTNEDDNQNTSNGDDDSQSNTADQDLDQSQQTNENYGSD